VPPSWSRRGPVRALVGGLIGLLVVSIGLLVAGIPGGSDSHPSSSAPSSSAPSSSATGGQATSTDPPAAEDVAAARACAAFSVYLADAGQGRVPQAAGEALVSDADALLDGAQADQAAGKPLPKWASLGEELINAADDVVKGDSAALKTDGTTAAEACQSVPANARAPGGYEPSGTSA
jgi:hypothetical protein